MKQTDQILKRISVLFYFFVALFIVGTIYGFSIGFMKGLDQVGPPTEGIALLKVVAKVIASLFILIPSIWSFVLFIQLLTSIGRSIAQKNIFNTRTIELINRYAKIYVVLIISMTLFAIIFNEPFVDGWLNFISELLTELSSVVMLLILGQVLKIGYILKEEQELTV